MDNNDITFGEMLRIYRKRKRMTIAELAEIAGVSKTTVSNYENNRSLPATDTFYKIARAIDAPVEKMLSILKEPHGNLEILFFD